MLQRIVDVAEEGRRLALSRGFLTVSDESRELGRVPLDDIAVLMISAPSGYLSKPLLSELAGRGAVTILCDKHYLPIFTGLPETPPKTSVIRVKAQTTASLPLKKNLWRSIIREKIRNQAVVLNHFGQSPEAEKIKALIPRVQSGDKGNKEAWVARIYWKALFGENFKRDRDAEDLNVLLNYGYTVLRSACARAVSSCGLLPMFGLMHESDRDYFALADDLMEPFRPLIDAIVKTISSEKEQSLTPTMKHRLSRVLWFDVNGKKGTGPLINALQDTALSLAEAFIEKKDMLDFPELFGSTERMNALCT